MSQGSDNLNTSGSHGQGVEPNGREKKLFRNVSRNILPGLGHIPFVIIRIFIFLSKVRKSRCKQSNVNQGLDKENAKDIPRTQEKERGKVWKLEKMPCKCV